MFDNELLDKWCENIQSDGTKIESAFATDSGVYICFEVNNDTTELFSNKEYALTHFELLMPKELKEQCKKQNYVLNGGSSRFVATDKEVVIGYVITLEELNGN